MLKIYNNLKQSPLENLEGIGLNRFVENDIEIHMRYTSNDSVSVDTPEDRNRIIKLIKKYYEDDGLFINDDGSVINCDRNEIS